MRDPRRAVCGGHLLDEVGCGTGFHLPRFRRGGRPGRRRRASPAAGRASWPATASPAYAVRGRHADRAVGQPLAGAAETGLPVRRSHRRRRSPDGPTSSARGASRGWPSWRGSIRPERDRDGPRQRRDNRSTFGELVRAEAWPDYDTARGAAVLACGQGWRRQRLLTGRVDARHTRRLRGRSLGLEFEPERMPRPHPGRAPRADERRLRRQPCGGAGFPRPDNPHPPRRSGEHGVRTTPYKSRASDDVIESSGHQFVIQPVTGQ
jgi:hypothetical protein